MNAARRQVSRTRQGFSLTENMIAISIVAATALPMLGMLALSMENDRSSDLRDEAVQIARQILADVQNSRAETGIMLRETGSVDGDPGRASWIYVEKQIPAASKEAGKPQSLYLAYGDRLRPLGCIAEGEFRDGASSSDDPPAFLVEVRFFPSQDLSGVEPAHSGGEVPSYLLSIRVTNPAAAALTNRQVETFSTRVVPTDRMKLP